MISICGVVSLLQVEDDVRLSTKGQVWWMARVYDMKQLRAMLVKYFTR
jgi:hypothetical protein